MPGLSRGVEYGWAQPRIGGREGKQIAGLYAVRTGYCPCRGTERALGGAFQPNLAVVLGDELALGVVCLAEEMVQAEVWWGLPAECGVWDHPLELLLPLL